METAAPTTRSSSRSMHRAIPLFLTAVYLSAVAPSGCRDAEPPGRQAPSPSRANPSSGLEPGLERRLDDIDDLVEIRIIHTADEHGWLEPATPPGGEMVEGGAAIFLSWIRHFEGYDPESFLLLSSGDNWTGPAVSTWNEGKPMVEAMNVMGYDAVAIGNHEFDFGRSTLYERFDHSEAAHLGANVLDSGDGEIPSFVEPFVILEVESVKVGIIGLANEETHGCTHPLSTLDLDFADYAETLDEHVPEMRSLGAEVVIVLAHACGDELEEMVAKLRSKVDVVFGAHCHKLFYEEVGSVPIVGSGWALRSYSKLSLLYDRESRDVVARDVDLVKVQHHRGGPRIVEPDADLSALVERWRNRTDESIGRTIGYTRTGVPKKSWAMANWVADSWLWAVEDADVSMVVFGGLRQFIDEGPITLSDVLGMLPFANTLMTVDVSGAELLAVVEHGISSCRVKGSCYPAVGGLSYETTPNSINIELFDGTELDPEATYTVVVTDYMFFGGSGYPFAPRSGGGAFTGINWRTPVVEWTRRLETSSTNPLEDHLDPVARNR